jgi:membrane-associated phospholipid phosphatase
MSVARAHTDTVRDIRQRQNIHSLPMRHIGFVAGEVVLLAILIVLTVAVRTHGGGPLPGDVGFQLDFQHWLRPHKLVTEVLDFASTVSWPIPAAISVAAVSVLLLVLRRWLDVIVLLSVVGLADGVDYVFSKWIHRARPSGHGIYVASSIKTSFSFPSGHVMQAMVFFGFLLFLTFQVRNVRTWWWWPLRALLLYLILAMGPSRILEGEHWPTDALAGYAYGGFWLLLAIHAYLWTARRWPKLRGRGAQQVPDAKTA